jgi:hypothetical protein
MDDMRPMLEEARPFFEEEMLPFLESLGSLIDDLSAYEMPERLPNGDIIIRRSPDHPWPDPDEPVVGEEGDVELDGSIHYVWMNVHLYGSRRSAPLRMSAARSPISASDRPLSEGRAIISRPIAAQ